MKKTYRELAEKNREAGGRAPKFNVKYFTRKEVKNALITNKYFTHACVELGLMEKGSKSPFNAIRNLHSLIAHFRLTSRLLGKEFRKGTEITCPHCEKKFKINLDN